MRHRRSRSCWNTYRRKDRFHSFLLPIVVAVLTSIVGRLWLSEQGETMQQHDARQCCLSLRLLFSSTCATAVRARAGKQQTQAQVALPDRCLLPHRRRCSDIHSRPTMVVRTGRDDAAARWSQCCWDASARCPARAPPPLALVLENNRRILKQRCPIASCCPIVVAVRTSIVGRLWLSEQGETMQQHDARQRVG